VAPQVARKSKTDAYSTARKLPNYFIRFSYPFVIAWVGAAPTGNRKRTVSNVEPTAQPSKKVKKGMHFFLHYFLG
jgi:hypothetical protein